MASPLGAESHRLEGLRRRTPAMVDDLRRLVVAESPSDDPRALEACADVVRTLADEHGIGPGALVGDDGPPHLRWRLPGAGDGPPVAVIGHLDTVWPVGTTARWPFEIEGDRATGPGVFDMKAGIVQVLHALEVLMGEHGGELPGPVEVLLTADEELGSPSSRGLVEETARRCQAALVAEPSADGALKTARKGVGAYRVGIAGRAAHAGLDPELGVNALEELAHQVLAVRALEDPAQGTTVTPTVAEAGTTVNVVPAEARFDVDIRARTSAELDRVDAAMTRLEPVIDGSQLSVSGGINRPPLPRSAAEALYDRGARIAVDLGLAALQEVEVGGGSDGNFAAAVGTPTLDGLGAVGAGAHAEGEHVVVAAMPERAALIAGLLADLAADPLR